MSSIGLDLDGVVYNFVGDLRDWLTALGFKVPEVDPEHFDFENWVWGLSAEELRERCDEGVNAAYLFTGGQFVPGAREGMNTLHQQGHKIHIVTNRYFGHRSAANTEKWLKEHSVPYDSLTFTKIKGVVDADIYLDDRPANVLGLRSDGKRGVLFDQPWNQDVPGERVHNWDEFVRLVNTPRIIGLGHAMQVGKDTAYHGLAPLGYQRLAFADKIKQYLYETDPSIRTLVDRWGWEEVKKAHPDVRQQLQDVGLKARKVLGEDVWLDAVWSEMQPDGKYVITDVRFPNEAERIIGEGGTLVRIDRPGFNASGHLSEEALVGYDKWSHVVSNDGSIQDLHAKVRELVP